MRTMLIHSLPLLPLLGQYAVSSQNVLGTNDTIYFSNRASRRHQYRYYRMRTIREEESSQESSEEYYNNNNNDSSYSSDTTKAIAKMGSIKLVKGSMEALHASVIERFHFLYVELLKRGIRNTIPIRVYRKNPETGIVQQGILPPIKSLVEQPLYKMGHSVEEYISNARDKIKAYKMTYHRIKHLLTETLRKSEYDRDYILMLDLRSNKAKIKRSETKVLSMLETLEQVVEIVKSRVEPHKVHTFQTREDIKAHYKKYPTSTSG